MKNDNIKLVLKGHSRYYMVIFLLLCIFSFFIFFVRGYYKKISYISGDEPHYIMMTDSLSKDSDFNLKNDYQMGRSINYYSEAYLMPHISPLFNINSEKWYSIHTIGLPLLFYIPYKFLGVVGVRIVVCVIQLISIYLFFLILKKYIKDPYRVLVCLVLIASCSLFWQNFGRLFPDLIMVTLLGACILLYSKKGLVSNFIFMSIVFFGILIHSKVAVLLIPIYVTHLIQLIKVSGFREFISKYFSLFLFLAIFIYLYIRFLYLNYGVLSPSRLYGNNGQLFSANLLTNILAIITDRGKGLLIYYPVLLIMGVYIARSISSLHLYIKKVIKNRSLTSNALLAWGVIIGSSSLLITQLGFSDWSGSYAPNGRYMLVFIFLLVFLIAKYVEYNRTLEIFTVFSLAGMSFLISIYFIFKDIRYIDASKELPITARIDYYGILPIFSAISAKTSSPQIIKGLMIIFLVVVFNIFLFYLFKRSSLSKITSKP